MVLAKLEFLERMSEIISRLGKVQAQAPRQEKHAELLVQAAMPVMEDFGHQVRLLMSHYLDDHQLREFRESYTVTAQYEIELPRESPYSEGAPIEEELLLTVDAARTIWR